MIRALLAISFSFAAASAMAAPSGASAVSDDLIKSLTKCSVDQTISRSPWEVKLPAGIRAEVISVESESPYCGGQHAALTMPSGRYFLGSPWLLTSYSGTREEKLKAFGWERMRASVSATIDSSKTEEGFHRVRIAQKTEYGDVITHGWIDPAGMLFLPGDFHRVTDDLAKSRHQAVQPLFATSPGRGPAVAKVTLVEFSDFQCPSCKASSAYLAPILARYDGKIRYVRVDYPLMSHHPWAFAAAAAGRAIYRQSPDAFWKYKNWVYENQADLSIFTLEDFASNFAKDNELDVDRYGSDVVSAGLRSEILSGIALASTINVSATPSFVINGVVVDPGRDGASLESYLETLLK